MTSRSPDYIIFSGGFDPPHEGHALCIKKCTELFPLADVLVMPSPFPAGASSKHKNPEIPFRDRLKLCILAFEDFVRNGQVKVSNFEEKMTAPNFTVQTLKKFKESIPDNNRIAFLLGLDQFESFPNWKDPLEILKTSDLIVVRRGDQEAEKCIAEKSAEVLTKLGLKFSEEEYGYRAEVGTHTARIYLIKEVVCPANSTDLRKSFQKNAEIPKGWLKPVVFDYLKKNGYFVTKETDNEDDCS